MLDYVVETELESLQRRKSPCFYIFRYKINAACSDWEGSSHRQAAFAFGKIHKLRDRSVFKTTKIGWSNFNKKLSKISW